MNIVQHLLNLVFPKFCCGCGKIGSYLCRECLRGLDTYVIPYNHKNVFLRKGHIDSLYSCVSYDGVFKRALKIAKYGGYKYIMEELCRELIGRYREATIEYVKACIKKSPQLVILPVPMHPQKRRTRGYNQADVIARTLSSYTGLPVNDKLILRTKLRKPQASLDRLHRILNAKNAFEINVEAMELVPKACILVDDVWTTGATAYECTRLLKYYGCEYVFVYSLAQRWYNND